MKHAKTANTRDDVAVEIPHAAEARSEQIGRHRAPLWADGLTPTSKLDECNVATVIGAKHRAAL
jgi:hypothetical protein